MVYGVHCVQHADVYASARELTSLCPDSAGKRIVASVNTGTGNTMDLFNYPGEHSTSQTSPFVSWPRCTDGVTINSANISSRTNYTAAL